MLELFSDTAHKIEMPMMDQDINLILADMIGWKTLEVTSEGLMVGQDNPRLFDYKMDDVINPIAQHYHVAATQKDDSWVGYHANIEGKTIVLISKERNLILALLLVFNKLKTIPLATTN